MRIAKMHVFSDIKLTVYKICSILIIYLLFYKKRVKCK